MKKMIFVRTLAAFLSMLMIISVLPFNIWAEDWIFGGGGKGNDTASESVAIDGLANKMEIVQLSNDITEIEYVKWGQYITNTDLSETVIGSGTQDDPYIITTPEAFVKFSENVNNGEYYKNCDYIYVELSRNIDFGELNGTEPKLDSDGNQIKAEWIPIGTEDHPFAGSFNGNLHEVKNYNISHSVNENGTSTVDAEEQYVGFFGYVKGSEIKTFGVYNFTVDYKYNFNTNIGALVGYSEDTVITDCYANGIIGASFEAINPFNPLNGDNVQEAKSLNESDVSGWALIYDFTKYSYNSELAVIPKNVTAVRFIGDPNKSYNLSIQILDNEYYDIYIEFVDFNFVGTSGKPAIRHESTNSPRNITICSRGNVGSSITGSKSNPAISAPESAVYINATAPLTICGGIGADGAAGGDGDDGGRGTDCNDTSNATPGKPGAPGKDGQTGASGAVGITADSLYINVDINVDISSQTSSEKTMVCILGGKGGTGGQGGKGGTGGTGGTGNGGTKSGTGIKNGAAGGAGGIGGRGGDGGQGGLPYILGGSQSSCAVNSDASKSVVLYHGLQGVGGSGGAGGNGGQGGDGGITYTRGVLESWGNGGAYASGGKGGNAGYGGQGGDGSGDGSIAGIGGTAGNVGIGGAAGRQIYTNKNGTIEYGRYNFDGKFKGRASSGDPARVGSPGTSSGTQNIQVEFAPVENFTAPFLLLYRAQLTAGGFIGKMGDGTEISLCAAVVNNINEKNNIDVGVKYPSNNLIGTFIGSYSNASVNNIIAAFENNGKLEKHREDTWCSASPSDTWGVSNINILDNGTDSVGFLYSNTAGNTCSVIGFTKAINGGNNKNSEIVLQIPDYVFSGRYITNVTEIIGRKSYTANNTVVIERFGAFDYGTDQTENSAIVGISGYVELKCGANIEKIGDYAFSGSLFTTVSIGDAVTEVGKGILTDCSKLKTVYIGASLSASELLSNEVKNEQFLFNIPKTRNDCAFKEYIVSEENKDLMAINGILCEALTIDPELGKIAVAVIDAPVNSELTDFSTTDLSRSADGTDCGLSYIVKIYANAFSHHKILETINLSYVREIGTNAFNSCTSLRSITFGKPADSDSITMIETPRGTVYVDPEDYNQTIGIRAFYGCTNLNKIDLSSPYIIAIGTEAFIGCCGTKTAAKITLGKNIVDIGFANGQDLTSDINTISICNVQNVFVDRNSQNNVAIDSYEVVEGNKHFYAEDGVLYHFAPYYPDINNSNTYAPHWELVAYPSHKESKDNTFVMPNKVLDDFPVTVIGASAFAGTRYLDKLTIADSVIIVNGGAFTNSSIKNLNIGAMVRTIGNGNGTEGAAFEGCSFLETITVSEGNGTYDSEDGILYGPRKLEAEGKEELHCLLKYPQNKAGRTFYVPGDVSAVGISAFSGNGLLANIVFESEVLTVGDDAFAHCQSLATVSFETGECPFSEVYGINPLETIYNRYFASNTNDYNSRLTILYNGAKNNGKLVYSSWESIGYSSETEEYRTQYVTQSNYTRLTVEASRGFAEIDDVNTGYYAFVIHSKHGELLDEIKVTLQAVDGSFSETVYAHNGICVFYDLDYSKSYTLKFVDVFAEYYPIEYNVFYLDEDTRVTYVTLSKVQTVSGVSAKYQISSDDLTIELTGLGNNEIDRIVTQKVVDINSQTAKLNKKITKEVEVQVVCNKNAEDTILSYSVVQIYDERQKTITPVSVSIDETNAEAVYITFTVSTDAFDDEADVYFVAKLLEVETKEEIEIRTKLNLHVFTFGIAPLAIPEINQNFKIGLSPELAELLHMDALSNIVGGNDLNFKMSISEDSYKIALEFGNDDLAKFGLDDSNDPCWAENFDNLVEQLRKPIKDRKPFSTSDNESHISLGFSITGFYEQKYNGVVDGVTQTISTCGLKGSLKFTFTAGTTITVVVVPVRVDVVVSLEGELGIVFTFDGDKKDFVALDMGVTATLDVSLGLGMKGISAGVYGNVKMYVLVELLPGLRPKELTVDADMGLYLKIDGLLLKANYRKSLLKVSSTTTYDKDGNLSTEVEGGSEIYSTAQMMSVVYDQSNYVLMRSAVEPAEFSFEGLNSDNAYEKYNPKLIPVGDLIYAVYHADLNGYSQYNAANYQKIVYQIYNTKTSRWSDDFYILDDNGLADGEFEVCSNGAEVFIVYSQLNGSLEATPEFEDTDDVSSYLKMHEIKTAKLTVGESQTFTVSEKYLTKDEFYDAHISIAIVNGTPTVVWIKNSNAQMFLDGDGVNTIYCSRYENSEWIDAGVLRSDLDTITDIMLSSDGKIVYITDNDTVLVPTLAKIDENGKSEDVIDEDNLYDKIINIIDLNNTAISHQYEHLGAYSKLSTLNGKITCYLNGNLYAVETADNGIVKLERIFEESISDLPDGYKVLKDTKDNEIAILYIKRTESATQEPRDGGNEAYETNSSNIFAIFKHGGTWGAPIQLTNYGEGTFVDSFEAIKISDDELLLSVLMCNKGTATVENGGETYFSQTDSIPLPTGYSMSEILFDYDTVISQAKSSEYVTVTLKVTNNGYLPLESLDVAITSGDYEAGKINISKFYLTSDNYFDTLGSGETAYVDVPFNFGEVADEAYTVTVGETTEELRLWYSDLEIHGKQVVISQADPDTEAFVDKYYLVLNVTNSGLLDSGERVLKLQLINYNDPTTSDDDTVFDLLSEQLTVSLAPGQSRRFEISIDDVEAILAKSGINLDSSWVVVATVVADDEYKTVNNETKINLSTQKALSSADDIAGLRLESAYGEFIRGEFIPIEIKVLIDGSYNVDFIGFMIDSEQNSNLYLPSNACYYDELNKTIVINWEIEDFIAYGGDKLTFCFKDEDGMEFSLSYHLAELFPVKWIDDTYTWHFDYFAYGTVPTKPEAPSKESDGIYNYEFIGWDADGDGIDDSGKVIEGSAEYVAIYNATLVYYTVSWIVDDAVIATEQYTYGQTPDYKGETPVKASDDLHEYEFFYWLNLGEVTGDMDIYAVFEEVHNSYTLTFKVGEKEYQITQNYGEYPVLPPDIAGDWSDGIYTYTFTGWSPELITVRGNQTYEAVYDISIREFDIRWIVDGNNISESYEYGILPEFKGSTDKISDARYTYEFIGWDKEISAVTGNETYIAVYKEILNKYTITWSVDGIEYTEEYEYGQYPEFKGSTFKDSDGENIYIFVGWDVEPYAVDGDRTYLAVYEAEAIVTVDVTINNIGADISGAVVIPFGERWIEGENAFTVTCQDVCLVLISYDGGNTYTLMEAIETDTDNCFSYIADDVTDDTVITVAVAGDTNGDGIIDGRDVLLLRQYMAALDYDTGISSVEVHSGADANGDGVINGRDVLLLRKYMVNYDYDAGSSTVVLGPQ